MKRAKSSRNLQQLSVSSCLYSTSRCFKAYENSEESDKRCTRRSYQSCQGSWNDTYQENQWLPFEGLIIRYACQETSWFRQVLGVQMGPVWTFRSQLNLPSLVEEDNKSESNKPHWVHMKVVKSPMGLVLDTWYHWPSTPSLLRKAWHLACYFIFVPYGRRPPMSVAVVRLSSGPGEVFKTRSLEWVRPNLCPHLLELQCLPLQRRGLQWRSFQFSLLPLLHSVTSLYISVSTHSPEHVSAYLHTTQMSVRSKVRRVFDVCTFIYVCVSLHMQQLYLYVNNSSNNNSGFFWILKCYTDHVKPQTIDLVVVSYFVVLGISHVMYKLFSYILILLLWSPFDFHPVHTFKETNTDTRTYIYKWYKYKSNLWLTIDKVRGNKTYSNNETNKPKRLENIWRFKTRM